MTDQTNIKRTILHILFFSFFVVNFSAHAQFTPMVNVDASKLLTRVEVSLSPRSGSFEEGSTFQVPIYLNTRHRSINGIEVRVNFDQNKLFIVNPTGSQSIIGVWVEPPSYNNTRGTASYVGVVPNGITTDKGLISTITFKAKAPGSAAVSISTTSKILLNDGLGSEAVIDYGRATYTILPKAPEGVQIFSETHTVQSDWYNNNTPVVSWVKDTGVDGFSFELDNKPNTVPDNTVETLETTTTYEALQDGLWYFHIKSRRYGVWSTTGHFLLRIDTVPPAEFDPEVNYLSASVIDTERLLVSFFTTDNLSGVSHYEVGVIDKREPATESPVFIQAQSPYQMPLPQGGKFEIIIRALDFAGNVRDVSVDVRAPMFISKFLKDNLVMVLIIIILIGLIMLLSHYLVGHHVIEYIRKARETMKLEKNTPENRQVNIRPRNFSETLKDELNKG